MIAMDIDGTLLDSTGQIPAENLQAIEEAAARGIEIVLVTGRRFDFALPIAEKMPGHPPLIVNNGALAKSLDGSTHIRSLLPRASALEILRATEEFREFAGVVFDRSEGHRVILETVNWDDPFRGGYLRRNREHIGLCAQLTDCLNRTNPPEDPIQVVYSGNCAPMRAVMQKLEPLAAEIWFGPIANGIPVAQSISVGCAAQRRFEGIDAAGLSPTEEYPSRKYHGGGRQLERFGNARVFRNSGGHGQQCGWLETPRLAGDRNERPGRSG